MIVNIASLAGRVPVPNAAAYSASKFGLRAFTFALGQELEGSGIKLAVVSPGPIDTGLMMADLDAVADINFSQPISTPDEVAKDILNICLNNKREIAITRWGGVLATTGYLLPWVSRALLPVLNAKGRRVRKKMKAKIRAAKEAEG